MCVCVVEVAKRGADINALLRTESLTSRIAVYAMEAPGENVAALSLASDAVVEALDVGGNIASCGHDSQGREGDGNGGLDDHFV